MARWTLTDHCKHKVGDYSSRWNIAYAFFYASAMAAGPPRPASCLCPPDVWVPCDDEVVGSGREAPACLHH